MKETMLTLALISTAITSFSQTTPPAHAHDYYITKSRHQKTVAWIMLGGGVVLTGLGFATTAVAVINNSEKSNTLPNVLAYVGLASSLASIPVFISAAHNRRKAAEVAFTLQKIPLLAAMPNRTLLFQPAIKLKIPL